MPESAQGTGFMTAEPIIYEQPISEHVRVCLRLEYLFNQIAHWLRGLSSWDSRAAMAAILETLNVLDRPDLKAKLVKELSRYTAVLAKFAETPHIDRGKLASIQAELSHTIYQLNSTQGRLAQSLRDNDFLNSIRQHLLNPGAGCDFEVPAYYFWLQQPPQERIAQLTHWCTSLRIVQNAVNLTLRLIRQSSASEVRVAHEGFFQATLDGQASFQLIRVMLPHGAGVYPEISVGRHGISIRFFALNLSERPSQTSNDIKFHLTCCEF